VGQFFIQFVTDFHSLSYYLLIRDLFLRLKRDSGYETVLQGDRLLYVSACDRATQQCATVQRK